jgi:hypothetical protein
MGLRRPLWAVRDKVLVPSSRMPVRMRLTGQLGRRGDEASWHRSSRRAAVAGGEMAFTREEENGMGVVRSAHDQVEEEEGGPTWHPAATTDRQRPGHAGHGNGCSKQRRWGTSMWAPWHSAGRPGQTTFNRFKN